MGDIAKGLEIRLLLLESTDLEGDLAGGKAPRSPPSGFERVSAVRAQQQAFLASKGARSSGRS